MAGYVVKEYSRLVSTRISPITARALVVGLDLKRVERLAQGAPEGDRERIRQELADLVLAAEFYGSRGTVEDMPAVPPVASVDPLERWISTAEAARILGKTSMTVRRYIEAGALEAKRKDKKSYLVLLESVEALRFGHQAAA